MNLAPIYEKLQDHRALSTKYYAALLPGLVAACDARTCIEIGIYHGWVSQILAATLNALWPKDGVLLSCDILHDFCDISREVVAKIGGVKHKIILSKSALVDWAAELQHFGRNKVGLCVIDGDHTYKAASTDLAKCAEVLAPNGLMVVHDYRPQDEGVFQAVNEMRDKWDIIVVPSRYPQEPNADVPSAILQKKAKSWPRK